MTRKRRAPEKQEIDYTRSTGRTEYVARSSADLRPELERIQRECRLALRVLSRLFRHRNAVLRAARFQLENCVGSLPATASDAEVAREIARTSAAMEDVVVLLDRLKNSRTPYIQEVRFRLTYGQTPKKRDAAGSFGKGRHGSADTDEEWSGEDGGAPIQFTD